MKRTRVSGALAGEASVEEAITNHASRSPGTAHDAEDADDPAVLMVENVVGATDTESAVELPARRGVPRKFARAADGGLIDVAATAAVAARAAADAAAAIASGPSSVLVQLRGMAEDAPAGATLDVPLGATPAQLELLVNELQSASERTPYTFYLNNVEVLGDLRSALSAQQLSAEAIHVLRYQPLAVFRVQPVSRCTDSMPGHTDAVLHVSFSPDGRTLASGGGDATVRFWDTSTCMPRHTCSGHTHHVLATAWAPDGSRFASADKSGEVRVWDPRTGKEVCTPLRGHKSWVTTLAWEPLHRVRAPVQGGGAPGSASYVSPCELLASSSKDKTVRVWNTRSGALEFQLTGHSDSVEAVRWGGEGLVYTASRDRSINVYSIEGGGSDGAPRRGKLIRTLAGHGHRVNSLALSTDALCRAGPWGHARESFKDAAAAHATAVKRYADGFAAQGGKELLVSCSDDFTLCLWDPADGKKPIARMTGHQAVVNHISFSPDGRYVASAGFDKKVKLWDGRTGKFLVNFNGHVGAVYQVCWSADARYVASASKDSTVKLWPARVGSGAGAPAKPVAVETLSGHADEVYALDWSPNGELLASGSKDRLVKIWRH